MFGGKALGWMAGTLIWMPGALGARRANVPSSCCGVVVLMCCCVILLLCCCAVVLLC